MGRFLICIGFLSFCLYSYVDAQNEVTKRRLEIPVIAKEIDLLKQTSTCLQYEIDLFESPEHLMELMQRSEYAYLKQPLLKEILVMQEAPALERALEANEEKLAALPRFGVRSVGAKH